MVLTHNFKKEERSVILFSFFLFVPHQWNLHHPPIYLNGLILFSDKTPPLPPATYLYIIVYEVVACWPVPYVGMWLMSGALRPGSKRRRRPFNEECKKKIHAFIGVVDCLLLCGDVNGRGSRRSSSCVHWI